MKIGLQVGQTELYVRIICLSGVGNVDFLCPGSGAERSDHLRKPTNSIIRYIFIVSF